MLREDKVQESVNITDVDNKVKQNHYVKTKKIFGMVFYKYEYTLKEEISDPKYLKGETPVGFQQKPKP